MIKEEKFSKRLVRMWGMSLDTWNNILLLFLAIAAVAAAVVGFSTYATIRLAKEESVAAKAELDAYKLAADEKVADAKREGIKAGENAANAQLKAAELEKEAAHAKLQTEQIKQVVTWRTLSRKNAEDLNRVLKLSPGRVNLRYTDGDPESLFLAIQLSKVLSDSGWQVAPGAYKSNAIVFGINLPDGTDRDAEVLQNAFSSASIGFSTAPVPVTGSSVSFNVATIPGAPTLMVGSRPPPILQ
ncbi:hypothetical protein QA646_10805 [Rhizobium sp. CB3090]|uniref:hypothetical protein n=1 Tax=Rhizobium sp. CB3090 TaxID=3039156 RepID=UPI0024B0FB81|nr:hypothetical protein [Rhizobium sp. CB3090]WFU07810.1 hypothetical protein QA646_10805 [Rhizobium sp. CB3090]